MCKRAAMILERLIELANVGVVQDLHDLNLLQQAWDRMRAQVVHTLTWPS